MRLCNICLCLAYFSFVWISLVISNAEHLFMHLLTSCMSLEKYLLGSSTHLKVNFFFWLLSCKSSFYILDISLLTGIWVANIFFHSAGCLFLLSMAFFCCTEALKLQVFPRIYFCFCCLRFWWQTPKTIAKTNVKKIFFLCFLLSLMISLFHLSL